MCNEISHEYVVSQIDLDELLHILSLLLCLERLVLFEGKLNNTRDIGKPKEQ